MNRVNSLDFSAIKKIGKPIHYERERGFRPLSARCFTDIEKEKQNEIIRVSELDRRHRSLFLASNFKPKNIQDYTV